jgi:hypothetical protein
MDQHNNCMYKEKENSSSVYETERDAAGLGSGSKKIIFGNNFLFLLLPTYSVSRKMTQLETQSASLLNKIGNNTLKSRS